MNRRHTLTRVSTAAIAATALLAITTVSTAPAWADTPSPTALAHLKADLDEYAGTSGTTGLTWGVDPASGTVEISVPVDDTDAATTKFLKRADKLSDDISVERVPAAPEPVLGPGDAIHVSGSRC